MKVQVKRAFKSYFFVTKKNKKAGRLCIKFSSTSDTIMQRCLYSLFQNKHPLFFEEFLNPQVRINKMVNEYTVDYRPSELTSRIHPFIFLWTPKGFYLCRTFLGFFLKHVYPTIVAEKVSNLGC